MGDIMKLYVVADMEGVSGVVSKEQTEGESHDYEVARRHFTDEIAALCMGAMEAGVEEIYVNDFHGNGRNILIERLPKQVWLIRGDFRPKAGYELLDNTFMGVALLGIHARSWSANGVIPHTYSPKVNFELFGQPVGEFDLLALIAGEKKVPTIFMAGDSATIKQARINFPSTNTVITKYSLGNSAAMCIHPTRVCTMLKDEIIRSIKNVDKIEPPEISPPVQLTITLNDVTLAERITWIPNLEQKGDRVFEFMGKSMEQIAEIVYGVTILVEKI